MDFGTFIFFNDSGKSLVINCFENYIKIIIYFFNSKFGYINNSENIAEFKKLYIGGEEVTLVGLDFY